MSQMQQQSCGAKGLLIVKVVTRRGNARNNSVLLCVAGGYCHICLGLFMTGVLLCTTENEALAQWMRCERTKNGTLQPLK